jgi:hypothetical protein
LVDALHRTRLTLDVYSCLVRSALDKRNAADVPVAPTAAHFWLDHGTAYRLGV